MVRLRGARTRGTPRGLVPPGTSGRWYLMTTVLAILVGVLGVYVGWHWKLMHRSWQDLRRYKRQAIGGIYETLARSATQRTRAEAEAQVRAARYKAQARGRIPRPAVSPLAARLAVPLATRLAVLLAGRKRLSLREEWRAHLAGENDRKLSPQEKLRAACGFVAAAVRLRLRD